MLAQWLAPLDLPSFLRDHLQQQPYARPGAAAGAIPLFGWETFDRVLRSERPVDVLTVSAGVTVGVPPPRSLADVRALMRRGVSVVVRAGERHDAGLAGLAGAFAEALPGGEVHLQLYATPGGTNAYGWHYDFEDVFIAQTAGAKDYHFRDNTVARDTVLGDHLDFGSFRRERSPLYTARLVPGDWLYLPARWWHLVTCLQDSLSISIGVMPAEAFRQARRIPPGWTGPLGSAHA
jgi:50S ribosomal protein L16 3-hydroxylase